MQNSIIKTIIYVICEGASEYNYIQELNRFYSDNNILLHMIAVHAGTGHFNNIKKQYRALTKKIGIKHKIVIWVDNDIYIRNDLGNKDKYLKKDSYIPDFLFSYMNFEDFLTLHNTVLLEKWTSICEKNNHFKKPMHASDYNFLYAKEIFQHYQKGELPSGFVINKDSLKTLFTNNRNAIADTNKIHSDFATFLDELFKQLKIEI